MSPFITNFLTLLFAIYAVFIPPAKVQTRHALTDPGDFLKVRGISIRRESGKGVKIALRGTNAGGWLVHEEWMCPTNAPDQQTIRDTLTDRFGAEEAQSLLDVYRGAYWTIQDFDNCAAMGMTAIRLPFTYMDFTDDAGNFFPKAFDRLDWFIENCARRGIYVILDLHGAYGSQNGKHHSGIHNDGRQLYHNEANRALTIRLWEAIAARYKGNPAVAAYDLLNEPANDTGLTGVMQWDFYDELYMAIRKVDPDHIIVMEACWNPPDALPKPRQYGWKNVMYSYHHYAWDAKDDQGVTGHTIGQIVGITRALDGVPILIGEFSGFGYEGGWRYTLKNYNRMGYHWTTWSYKATGDTSWGLYNHNPPRVDIYGDSAETIREKWSQAGGEYAREIWVKGVVEEYM